MDDITSCFKSSKPSISVTNFEPLIIWKCHGITQKFAVCMATSSLHHTLTLVWYLHVETRLVSTMIFLYMHHPTSNPPYLYSLIALQEWFYLFNFTIRKKRKSMSQPPPHKKLKNVRSKIFSTFQPTRTKKYLFSEIFPSLSSLYIQTLPPFILSKKKNTRKICQSLLETSYGLRILTDRTNR